MRTTGLARCIGMLTTVTMAFIAGCKSGAASGGYVEAYRAGDFQSAYDSASAAAQSGPKSRRDQARLIAGQSAHALHRNSDAAQWLESARASSDAQVSGHASATLGLIAREQGSHQSAAVLLETAADKLTGEEADRASRFAAEEYALAGRPDDATRLHARTGGATGVVAAVPFVTAPAGSGGYTISFGAFSTVTRAQQRLGEVRPETSRRGLGEAVLVQTRAKSGTSLYSVQAGRFGSRTQAETARRAFRGESAVIEVR